MTKFASFAIDELVSSDRMIARVYALEESLGSTEKRCQLTTGRLFKGAGKWNRNIPPCLHGKGEMVCVRDHRFFSNKKGNSKPHLEQDQIGITHKVFPLCCAGRSLELCCETKS